MAVLTKARQVERILRDTLQSGRWSPGDALPAEREMLSEFGVSHATLREALSVLANEGLLTRRQGSGTYVAHVPETGTVAILAKQEDLLTTVGSWYRNLVEEATRRIDAAGLRGILTVGRGASQTEFEASINLLDRAVAKSTLGVLAVTDTGPVGERLAEVGVPTVTITHTRPVGRYCVVLDYARVTELAAQMLAAHGYEDFAVMYADFSAHPVDDFSGRNIKEYALLFNPMVQSREDRLIPVPWTLDYANAYRAFRQWWGKPDRPKAMYFADDALFEVASRAILELGIKVPEDLAVLTHANKGRRFHFPVQPTSIGFDPKEAVDIAWNMLESLISGRPVAEPAVYLRPIVRDGGSLVV